MKNLTSLCLLIMLLFSCRHEHEEEKVQSKQMRIVCLAKQYTEIIFALGAEKNLIATDLSSTFPPKAKLLPKVGYHRALSLEPILSAKPGLIIHDNNIGPEHVVKQLADLNIPVKTFGNYSRTIEGTDSLIREMGHYFDRDTQADSLCKIMREGMRAITEPAQSKTQKLNVCIIHYGQASNVYLVMTGSSTAARLVEWAGGVVTATGEKSMLPLSPEVIAKSDPDIILLTDYGYDRLGDQSKIKELPGVGQTRAAANGRVYRVEEHDLVYLGPRTPRVVEHLRTLFEQNSK